MGALMVHGLWSGPLRVVDTYIWSALTDGGHQWILAFALTLGGLMQVIGVSGASHGMARGITRYAVDRKRGQLTAWFMGLIFFFDDYANTLFVGSSMAPVFDRLKVSREKLAFIVDATAAPVASLAPISSWIAVEIGYIADQCQRIGLETDAYGLFLQTVPSRFYPVLMLAFGLCVALTGRDLGPMLSAERERLTHQPTLRPSQAPPPASGSHWLMAALPLLTVLVIVFLGLFLTGRAGALEAGEALSFSSIAGNADSSRSMVYAASAGGVMAVLLAARRKDLGLVGALRAWLKGAGAMLPVVMVLTLAWSLGALCDDLQTARYLVSLLGGGFVPGLLPAAVFLVSAVVSFATGTSWGTMGILFPLAVPLAHQLVPGDQLLVLGTVSSILAGSVFGDHCSPISDTTIMSAMASGCDQIGHVRTQLPYALIVGAVSVAVGSIPVGLGLWSPWVALLLGTGVLWVVLRFAGKTLEAVPPAAAKPPTTSS